MENWNNTKDSDLNKLLKEAVKGFDELIKFYIEGEKNKLERLLTLQKALGNKDGNK